MGIYMDIHVHGKPGYGNLTVFRSGGRPPSWICWVRIRTTHNEHLVVFSVVQILVGIDAVVLIICRFQYFAC